MNSLFVKNKIIPEYLFEDIVYNLQNVREYESGVFNYKSPGDTKNGIEKKIRDSFSKNLNPSQNFWI
jgi:hypothetical protein